MDRGYRRYTERRAFVRRLNIVIAVADSRLPSVRARSWLHPRPEKRLRPPPPAVVAMRSIAAQVQCDASAESLRRWHKCPMSKAEPVQAPRLILHGFGSPWWAKLTCIPATFP